jgi:hypothetical protein
MAKDKDMLDIKLEEEIAEIFDEMDKKVETESTDNTTEGVVESEVEQPLFVMVKFSANLRTYPNHTSKLLKRLRDKTEHEVLEITEGSLVALSNIWYQIDGGYVHASQVELM